MIDSSSSEETSEDIFVNKSKQLQLIEEGDPFVRSGETIEEAEKR